MSVPSQAKQSYSILQPLLLNFANQDTAFPLPRSMMQNVMAGTLSVGVRAGHHRSFWARMRDMHTCVGHDASYTGAIPASLSQVGQPKRPGLACPVIPG